MSKFQFFIHIFAMVKLYMTVRAILVLLVKKVDLFSKLCFFRSKLSRIKVIFKSKLVVESKFVKILVFRSTFFSFTAKKMGQICGCKVPIYRNFGFPVKIFQF